jgi:DNA-binding transcriptional MocR family regulator
LTFRSYFQFTYHFLSEAGRSDAAVAEHEKAKNALKRPISQRHDRYTFGHARPFYKSVREAFRRELGETKSAIHFNNPPAGPSILAELPKELDANRFAVECKSLGVVIAPANDYFLNPQQGSSCFRICFGGVEPSDAAFVAKAFERACERTALGSGGSSLI